MLAYINNAPSLTSIGVLAGASIDPKVYYNHRFELDPPESLLKEIFPFVEETISHFKAQIARKEISTELSGMGFLNLLKHLRTVILQDAAILMEDPSFKNHKIFNHQLFLTKEFEEFAINLRTKIITDPDPEQILIQRALPHIGTSLTRIDSNLVVRRQPRRTNKYIFSRIFNIPFNSDLSFLLGF